MKAKLSIFAWGLIFVDENYFKTRISYKSELVKNIITHSLLWNASIILLNKVRTMQTDKKTNNANRYAFIYY